MKVLMLNHNQERFGTYWRCLWLGKGLAELGHKVTIVCASGRNFDLQVRKQSPFTNLTVITLPRIKYGRYLTGQLFRLFFYLYYALFSSYDILHAFTVAQPQIGLPAWLAKKIRGVRLVVDWDDLWGGGFADYHSFPIRQGLTFFENFIPRSADGVTVVSEFLREKALASGIEEAKIHKIINGSNVREIRPSDKGGARRRLGLNADSPIIISVGNTYYSSIGVLFETFCLVVKRVPQAKLFIVGQVLVPDWCRQIYEAVRSSVVITGSVPFEQAKNYLAAADVLVLPMGSEPIEAARYPIRLGDYLASGQPVVSNAVGEVKLVLENYHCGLVSPVSDLPLFAENILRIINDKSLSLELGQKALAVATEFSWETVTGQLVKVYEKLSGNPTSLIQAASNDEKA